MTRLGKILLRAVLVLFVLLAVGITFTIGWRPFIGPKVRRLTQRRFQSTPERLARGRYLFNGLTGCVECHSQRDMNQHGWPVTAGTEGGGQIFTLDGLPGRVVAPNITPDAETGSGAWTDDELARAIREGIGHDGKALFPLMPYSEFRYLSDEDLASIIVYIRTLTPIHKKLPKTEITFPVNYLIRSAPDPITQPVSAPDSRDKVQWGGYIARIGGCIFCHTPDEHGSPLPGMDFGGGKVFSEGGHLAASANITPDASGISYYSEETFLQVLRTGYVGARPLSPIMPYALLKSVSDDDLRALFAFLRTVRPVKHRVDNSLPLTACKVCRQKHGAGDQN